MTDASQALLGFVYSAVKGICNESELATIEAIESGPSTVTIVIKTSPQDMKFILPRMREIRILAIAIAKRYRVIAHVMFDDE